ncbi:polysaccharide deacetylase family protein [Paenibacillus radicis (ex Xue et al. 2023)]|uniref:Polysaccharide deacetylase family protein n=1 Tax=Paenibacillus radicis (ex Xue et al. 2023) TaxID=2972489 RepID=A0ABT1YNE4_9BACL|nr:polysaccharide deacetylase family protein [Paenibacillus radicis (ex Xue et al. 2023)]MCR8634701.1 polysaccharide deacetylase family protein [Paenibacillus radicis (ex Xue et al. 2023)]
MNKLILKAAALSILGLSIILPSLYAANSSVIFKDQVAVIMYHHVDDEAKSSGTVTTQLFKDQLSLLKNKGYQFITLQQFKEFMQGASVPHNAVLVTFDDGYESFYTNAYPILKSMRIPAVNFVITGDLEDPLASYIPSMSRDEIIEMTSDTNFIDLQCHTNSMHQKLPDDSAMLVGRIITNGTKETEDEYKQRVLSDTGQCVSKLSELYPEPIDSYAYPFGIYDKLSSQYIQQAGMRFAFTIVPEMATRDLEPLQIPRINAGNSAISPEGLETSIRRRVVATNHPFNEVPLMDTMSQLGGKASLTNKNQIQIQYQNTTWVGSVNSQKLTSLTGGKTINLQKPLYMKNNVVYIGLKDLETAIGVQIVYNPTVQSFSVRQTPVIKK